MTEPSIAIAGRTIDLDSPPLVVAEMSANHLGDLSRALKIIDAAKHAGADAVKLQTYRPDTITHRSASRPLTEGPWAGRSLYELYEEAHTPWEWHADLFAYGRKAGITMFSSPFDETAIELLEGLGCPAYKIASFELVDTPLIRTAAGTGKPLIISTGMGTWEEIDAAVVAARDAGATNLVLMHAVSAYPTPIEQAALATLPVLAKRHGTIVGLSDHTLGITAPVVAIALGARVIEKHLTLKREDGGPDAGFSLEPQEFAAMVAAAGEAFRSLGAPRSGTSAGEETNRKLRRSLHARRDLPQGTVIGHDDVVSLRPADGIPPSFLDTVVGRRTSADIPAGTAVRWELLDILET
ncbi:MAG: pseudaminic acid synthase [Actinomycetota bacterium]|nr:pseudaminic acid synthase [Actinomycetota bacterium]